jgi:hypothetical protein
VAFLGFRCRNCARAPRAARTSADVQCAMTSPFPGGGGSRPGGTRGGVRGDAGIRSALRALSPQPAALRASTFPLQGKVRRKSLLARGRKKKKGTRRAQTHRPRSQIAEISRSVLRRPGAGRAGLLRLFRLLARLPLSAVPPCPRLSWRRNRLHRSPPRRRVPPFRRGKSPRAGAYPERCRRAGAPRVDERLLHRDLGKGASESEIMSATRPSRPTLWLQSRTPPFAQRQCVENPPAIQSCMRHVFMVCSN